MARAQLEMNITADGRQAKKEIREVKKEGVDAVEEIQAKNNEASKQVIGMFAPMAIAVQAFMSLLAGVTESIRKYFAQGEIFVEWGKKAEIGANSVAYLKAQADAAGISAKEFERSMEELGAGKTTIAKLQEEWQGLTNTIAMANNAQENFVKLARMKNFELFGEGASTFFGGLAEGAIELLGGGGGQIAAIERAAYEGKSYEEAMWEGMKARRGWHAPIMQFRKDQAYAAAVNQREADRYETEKRFRSNVAVKLMSNPDLTDEQRVQLFREETGISAVVEYLADMAQEAKTREEKLNERIKEEVDANKAQAEAEKKRVEAEKRRMDEETKARRDYETIVKKIAAADITDSAMEKIFAERTGETKTAEEIRTLAESVKSRDELMNDAIAEAVADKRKAEEMARKEKEDAKAREKGLSAIDTAIAESFTAGGGLINNANYGLKFGGVEQETLREMRQQTRLAQEQAEALASIEQAITED